MNAKAPRRCVPHREKEGGLCDKRMQRPGPREGEPCSWSHGESVAGQGLQSGFSLGVVDGQMTELRPLTDIPTGFCLFVL